MCVLALFEIKDRIEHEYFEPMSPSKFSLSSEKNDTQKDDKPKFVLKKTNKDGSPDLRYKENRDHFLAKDTNADGSLDMRKLINRKKMGLYKD